jgi:PilZ domain-containing protein
MGERRSTSRRRSFLQGRIYFNQGRDSADCLIRDFSKHGARLKFTSPVATPDVLELHVSNKQQRYQAKVEWRVADEMGVAFVADDSVPLVPVMPDSDMGARVQKLEYEFAQLQRKVNELLLRLRSMQGAAL